MFQTLMTDMPHKDPEQRKEYHRKYNREYYQKNMESEKQRVRERKTKLAEWFHKYKETLQCEECGETTPCTLEFHHRNPDEKEGEVSNIAGQGWGKQRILEEISKCTVLCANCHRKVHYV